MIPGMPIHHYRPTETPVICYKLIFNATNTSELRRADLSPKGIVVRKGGFRGQNPPLKNGVQAYIHGNK